MAYEIPPPLEHKERIIFGLTFEQLAYAVPSFLLIVVVLFKTKLHIYTSGTIACIIAFVAAFFMFFDGKQYVQNWLNFQKNKEVTELSTNLLKLVDIRKIDNGIVEKKKERLALLEITPLNFMLKTDEEKESIIVSFQKFLNSMDFPIQLHITSSPIHLDSHFRILAKKIEERAKKLRKQLFKIANSYELFVRTSSCGDEFLNRTFYLIIKEKDNLDMQVNVCIERLSALGLRVKKLSTQDIVDFFHSYISHNKSTTLAHDTVNVGHMLYAPQKVSFFSDHYAINDEFYKIVTVTGYPHNVEMGFLDKIISLRENYDISIHIEPQAIDDTMIQLNRDLQKQQADLFSDTKKGILNPSLEIKYQSTRKILEDLQKGFQKLFNVSVYVMCRGKSKKEVSLLAKRVKAELDGLMLQSQIPLFQSMEAYGSTLPLANDLLKKRRNVHTQGLAAFFPFSSPFLDTDEDGVLLGLNKNKIPVIKDVFKLSNANGVVLATSGAGKSYFTKLFLSRNFMNGADVLIIDPQDEYVGITQKYKGQCVTISRTSKTIINPLDLMGHDYLEKRLTLIDVFGIMCGGLNEVQRAILDKAIDLTYENCGITAEDYQSNEPPRMTDLFKTLEKLETKAMRQEKVTYRALLNRIQMYTEKGVFGFLDRQTSIDFNNQFVCFNIGSMPKQVKPVVMYLILDYVYMKMKESKQKKILVIDEAWSLLQGTQESSYVFEIVKTCRKFNLGLLMITQDVADLLRSQAGNAVLSNTSYTFLLRQKPAVIDGLKKVFNLSQLEKEFLLSAQVGHGLVLWENEHLELEVIASDAENKVVTTNPNEATSKKEKAVKKKPRVRANINLEKHVHRNKGLTKHQINVLNNHEYVSKKCHNLEGGPYPYFIKPRYPEGIEHTFLVDIIVNEISKYTSKVWMRATKEPDIVFENKEGLKIALEIETGAGLIKKRKAYNEKFAEFHKSYGDRGYIVLTDIRKENSYKKFGMKILARKHIKEFVRLQFTSE